MRRVKTERRDGVQPAPVQVGPEASANRTRGVGEGARGCVDVGVTEDPRAQSLTGDGFAAVQGQVRHHLDAASPQRRGECFGESGDLGVDAQQFDAHVTLGGGLCDRSGR